MKLPFKTLLFLPFILAICFSCKQKQEDGYSIMALVIELEEAPLPTIHPSLLYDSSGIRVDSIDFHSKFCFELLDSTYEVTTRKLKVDVDTLSKYIVAFMNASNLEVEYMTRRVQSEKEYPDDGHLSFLLVGLEADVESQYNMLRQHVDYRAVASATTKTINQDSLILEILKREQLTSTGEVH